MHKNLNVFLYLNGKNMMKGVTSKQIDVFVFFTFTHIPKNFKWEIRDS